MSVRASTESSLIIWNQFSLYLLCVCFYLHSVRPGYLAIQKCVQRMPQYLFSLWTAAADDVTGGANASEEVRIDRWRWSSRGNIGQVHVHTDFPSGVRLWDCDRRNCCMKLLVYSILYDLHFTPCTWIGWGFCWCWTGGGGRCTGRRDIPLCDSTLASCPAFPWSLGGLSKLVTIKS